MEPITLSTPSPDEGWSREIVTIRNALVVPPDTSAMVQPCGVLDAEGRFVPASATWRGHRPMMTPPGAPVTATGTRLTGRHLWLGQHWVHFGHYMVESLARIWAYDPANKPDSVVFIPKRPGRGIELMGWQRQFMELLGVEVPVTIIEEPTEIEELIVPGQGFGLGTLDRGTPEFRDKFHRDFARDIAPDGPEKLYLSRSALGGTEGSIILEELLEQNLAAEGYEILHPQKHSIARQIAYYKAAKYVVGPDGSAFHLFGFVAREDQRAAVILRRTSSVYNGLKNQIHAFSGREPDVISALNADWIPDDKGRPGRYSFGQLDFEETAAQLARTGYIEHPEAWEIPSFRDQKRAIDAFGARKGLKRRTKGGKARGRQADDTGSEAAAE